MSGSYGVAQWGRQLSIIIADQSGQGTELIVPSDANGNTLHVTFTVRHLVIHTPSTLILRIYNLSEQTAGVLSALGVNIQESNFGTSNGQVVVKAGYSGNYGTIFTGGVRFVRKGRENPTDTYVDIYAATWDLPTNWGVVNITLKEGHAQTDIAKAAVKSMASDGYPVSMGTPPNALNGTVPVQPPTASPRGRALYGNARDILRDLAAGHDNTWSFAEDGTLNFLPRTAYAPGDAVVLTSYTGMIGLPQLTDNGVKVRCLLNPVIKVGTRLQIDNKSIQQPAPNLVLSAKANIFPSLDADGFYKVLWVDHSGDNRGLNWYSDMICISIDPSAQGPFSGVLDLPTGIPP
jgi:hypothetical protein